MSNATPSLPASGWIAAYRAQETKVALGGVQMAGLVLVMAALVAGPLFLIGVPPLTDYPAHLVRVSLLSHLPLDPLLSDFWQVEWKPLPNLAMDLFVVASAPLLGADLALKLFVALGAALWVAGAVLLYRAFWREWAVQPLYAVFFAVNPVLTNGFVNSYFGFGLALTAAGLWAMARKRPLWLVLAMSGVSLVLLTCHLMALGLFALLVGGFELYRLQAERGSPVRALGEGLLLFVPAALAWALLLEHGEAGGLSFKWLANLAGPFIYSSAAGGFDHNMLPSLAMLGAAAWGWRTGRLRIARAALPAVAMLGAATLLCPAVAMSGAFVNLRLPAVLCVVLLVSGRIELEPRRLALAALLVAGFVSAAFAYAHWRAGAEVIAEIRTAGARIEPGARVATAMLDVRGDYPLSHAVSPVALDRSAFLPEFFTYRGQSTILVTPPYRRIASQNAAESGIPSYEAALRLLAPQPPALAGEEARALRPYRDMACEMDYLFVIGEAARRPPPPSALQEIVAAPSFALYRIVPPPQRNCPARG